MKTDTDTAQEQAQAPAPWRAALNFIIEGIGTIDRYPTRDLYALCGLEWAPSQQQGESGERFRRRFDKSRRTFSTFVSAMKRELGESHRVDLRATGEGAYEIVPHDRHVRTALRETVRGVVNALGEGSRRLDAFDTARATDAQMREHANAAAHVDAIRILSTSRRQR